MPGTRPGMTATGEIRAGVLKRPGRIGKAAWTGHKGWQARPKTGIETDVLTS